MWDILKRIYYHVFPDHALNGPAVQRLAKEMKKNPDLGKGVIAQAEKDCERDEALGIRKIDPKWEEPK